MRTSDSGCANAKAAAPLYQIPVGSGDDRIRKASQLENGRDAINQADPLARAFSCSKSLIL
jgi:hypothetical protein